jgi:hypothetical protein
MLSPPRQTSMKLSPPSPMGSSLPSTTEKSSMPWSLNVWPSPMTSSPPPIETYARGLSDIHDKLIGSLSFPCNPLVTRTTTEELPPRSPLVTGTMPMQSGSNYSPTDESTSSLGRITTRTPLLLTYSSPQTTSMRRSPSLCLPGFSTSSTAPLPPTTPSTKPPTTSMTGLSSQRSSAIAATTTDAAALLPNSRKSKPRLDLLRTHLQLCTTTWRLHDSLSALQIWKDEPSLKLSSVSNAPGPCEAISVAMMGGATSLDPEI